MRALHRQNHALVRWLLSLPGLDTGTRYCCTAVFHSYISPSRDSHSWTALHLASAGDTPLDILVQLVTLSNRQTLNTKDVHGNTALDEAVMWNKEDDGQRFAFVES